MPFFTHFMHCLLWVAQGKAFLAKDKIIIFIAFFLK